ncbi:ABA4-like family protein [Parvularcula maris]|uniref:ABA4-like family protein n=1 Tax=Parvularcula maris TaxID=2965077 RepID=A0A9X2RJR3_9PROT|nr:ABA4-like family protein [Parvularcula maris]MCQ8184937.1 ABA4-like family protein [Parvularcula maris]
MSADLLFQITNTGVLPVWLLLAVRPGWRWSQIAAFGVAVPLLALTYAAVLISLMASGGMAENPDFGSIDGVQALFSDRYGFVAAWTHYLAFDLFVGAWIARDGSTLGLPRLILVPALFFTLMAGPFGLLIYLVFRQVKLRSALAEPLPFANKERAHP